MTRRFGSVSTAQASSTRTTNCDNILVNVGKAGIPSNNQLLQSKTSCSAYFTKVILVKELCVHVSYKYANH